MNEHISYEYNMMKIVGDAWFNGGTLPPDVVNNMCTIVCYVTAKNLVEYLEGQDDLL